MREVTITLEQYFSTRGHIDRPLINFEDSPRLKANKNPVNEGVTRPQKGNRSEGDHRQNVEKHCFRACCQRFRKLRIG